MSAVKHAYTSTNPLEITPENASSYLWIYDFFERTRGAKRGYWHAGEVYEYQGTHFVLYLPTFARLKKRVYSNDMSLLFTYEMVDFHDMLGMGRNGDVYRIRQSISKSKHNQIRARDKKRVVKISNNICYEYQQTKYAKHLHAKDSIYNYDMIQGMVMRELPGITLYQLLRDRSHQFSRQERWDLTLAIMKAVKEQISDVRLRHNDLHLGNVLVEIDRSSERTQFNVNIIDYGAAQLTSDLYAYDTPLIFTLLYQQLWNESIEPSIPAVIHELNDSDIIFITQDEVIHVLESTAISPRHQLQSQLDDYFYYLLCLEEVNPTLAGNLRKTMQAAALISTENDIEPMHKAIFAARNALSSSPGKCPDLPPILIAKDPKQQRTIDYLADLCEHLRDKAYRLDDIGDNSGCRKMLTLVKELEKNIYPMCYHDLYESPQKTLTQAVENVRQLLQANKTLLDKHCDSNYIFAEIGAVLASSVVFYPLIAAMHYLSTGRFGIFSQTKSAAAANCAIQMTHRLCNESRDVPPRRINVF